ncbi:MAG TPA: GGDEF domain-containing protein, partial [Pyrinomonadaceae bacterium]
YTHRMYLANRQSLRVFECYGDVFADPSGAPLRVLGTAHDITAMRRVQDEMTYLAEHDPLTDLPNRRALLARIDELLTGSGEPLGALLLIDIDNFKGVNDTYGHDAGDEALRRVANVIQSGTRGIDTGARIGGDEFAVILPETDLARGVEVAERLRSAIAALDFGPAGRLTASLGVAEFPACARANGELRAAADAALYEAKRGGRDRAASAPVLENPAPALGVS